MKENETFQKLYGIVARLRGPGGCPWDREQTPLSLRDDLIEETYECIEAIDERNPDHVKEELGDIFLLVTMLAYIHEQEGSFSVTDTLQGICEKLIRRHPHVFAANIAGTSSTGTCSGVESVSVPGGTALTSDEALKNWARIKVEQEGRRPKDSALDEVSRGLPPLDRAWKLQKKAAKLGFDWPDSSGVIGKIREELREVEEALDLTASGNTACGNAASGNIAGQKPETDALEGELGDLLFSVVNLCRFFGIEPSLALQRTNLKFTGRFKHVEKRMKEAGQEMSAQNLALMDEYWNEAKKHSKIGVS